MARRDSIHADIWDRHGVAVTKKARILCIMFFACVPATVWCAEHGKIVEEIIAQYVYEGATLDETQYQELLKTKPSVALESMRKTMYKFEGGILNEKALVAILNSDQNSQQEMEYRRRFVKVGYFFMGVGALFLGKSNFEEKPQPQDSLNSKVSKSIAPDIDRLLGVLSIGIGSGLLIYGNSLGQAIKMFNGETSSLVGEQDKMINRNNPFSSEESPF